MIINGKNIDTAINTYLKMSKTCFPNCKYHIYSFEQFKVTISECRTFQNVIRTFQNVSKIKVTKCGEKCSKCGKNELEPFSMGKRT